jgi:flavin reductase (DIM6/NTAB) family NADH-FMN oxidoreductase RutF
VLKHGQLDLADRYGRSARADELAVTDWTNDRTGPPLLRKGLAWFECQFVDERPAGDHVLVVGRVIDGKLVDSETEPMCYRETGAMDGTSTLYRDVFG